MVLGIPGILELRDFSLKKRDLMEMLIEMVDKILIGKLGKDNPRLSLL